MSAVLYLLAHVLALALVLALAQVLVLAEPNRSCS